MADIPAPLAEALRDRYVLERELGRGGMATVYLAHDVKHDRPVALKVLHPDLAANLGTERFQREIRLAARLNHPHILTVHDSGEAAGRLWFTMPFVSGESLRDRLRRERRLPPDEALRIAREAALALDHAHQEGVIHRDIKPENLLLTRDGSTLVADFGIARPLAGDEPLTQAGMSMGTPAYMSPEQAVGDPLDARTDVYSLACVLFEMLTGRTPFTAQTGAGMLARHLAEPPPALDPADASVPPAVSRAITRALAKSPADRFAGAAEFARALEPAAARPLLNRRTVTLTGIAALGLLGLTYYLGRQASVATSPMRGGTLPSGFSRKLTQLTFGPGLEEWPAWAPDGKQLAYSGEVDGYRQLVVRGMPDGTERRVTQDARDHIQPAWSPDGKRLAFVRARADRGKLEPGDLRGFYYEGGDIWTVDLASGAETQLVDDAFDPAWSPDGAQLAFDADRAGSRRIWVTGAGGHNPRQITSDSTETVAHTEPRWSPDGSRLAFRRIEKTRSQIVVVDLASQAAVRVTGGNSGDMDPAWSADGRYIYFASDRGGGLNLWRVPVAVRGQGGGAVGPPEQLTTGAGDDVEPALAPGGGIAFTVRGTNSDIWRLPLSPETGRPAGEPEPVVATTREESRGAWSPDGGRIAFNSDRLGEMNLWLRDLAAGTDRQLTSGPGGDYQPNWAPDGQTLAFFSARAGSADIWTVRLADGRLTRLTTDPRMDINPFYSPDGSRIAFISDRSGRGEVWVMGADGSGQRQLTTSGASGHFLRWARDGRSLLFRGEMAGQLRIFRVSADDGAVTPAPDVSSGAHMSFSPDESLILDVRGHKTLWIHPADGRPPYEVFAFPNRDIRIDYPVWSPDGKWVLFDRAVPRGSDLWLLQGVP